MSDSSSSDGEESRFREVCDPTLWRTAAEAGVDSGNSTVQAADSQHHHHHHHSSQENRQSFLLLERIHTSLASSHTRKAGSQASHECPDTHTNGSRRTEARRERLAAPSTLAPFLARQLAKWLDRTVEYCSSQDCYQAVSGEHTRAEQQPLCLFKNLPLMPQGSGVSSHTQERIRKSKVPKRLSYFDSSDEEEVMARCRSVVVTPERILAGVESWPYPHPKNVRYLQEFRVEETRPDGSMVAVACAAPDTTSTTAITNKNKARHIKIHGSQSGEEENTPSVLAEACGFQNGGAVEELGSDVKKQRKQARKRGKRKKVKDT